MNYLVGVDTLYDDHFTVVFTEYSVTVIKPQDKAILTGWCERTGPKLWCFSLCTRHQPVAPTGAVTASLKSFSTYDLPNIEALVHYLYAAAGFPVKLTWLTTINNAFKYYLAPAKTLLSHIQ